MIHVGCSNFSAAQIDEAARIAGETGGPGLTAAQMHWNLLERRVEADVVAAALRAGSGIVPYFPLASGMLTGKYRKDEFPLGSRLEAMPRFRGPATEENFAYIERLRLFAEEHEHTLLELALGWLAAQEVWLHHRRRHQRRASGGERRRGHRLAAYTRPATGAPISP